MKKVIFTVSLGLLLAVQGLRAQQDPQFKEDTIEFLKMTGATGAFDQLIAQMGAGVPEMNRMAYTEEATGTLDGLYGKMADLYMEEFSHDEIKKLMEFYSSDLGKKVAGSQMALMQKAAPMGQAWAMELQQIAQKHSN